MHLIARQPLVFSRTSILATVLACALLLSSIVFSEPAPVDAMLAAFIAGLFVLGGGRFGPMVRFGLVAWTVIVAAGFLAAPLSPDLAGAIKHQAVTLFLALAAAAIGAYVAADPVPRARLVLDWYTAGAMIACACAYIGYFDLLPGAYDLFTNYGRARGPFKDPNVFGAAICPAIVYVCWLVARHPLDRSWLPALCCAVLMPALLISFSRGAWLSLVVSLMVLGYLAVVRTRRRTDLNRMGLLIVAGSIVLCTLFGAALQSPKVADLFAKRASLTQSYDEGPEGRFGGQRKALLLIGARPFGIGTHTFREVHHHEEVHNVYLTTFLNAGWLPGFAFILLTAATLAAGLRGAWFPGPRQTAFAVATAAFAGMAFEGIVIDSDHWRHLFILSGLIWGLADASEAPAVNHGRRATDRLVAG